MVTRTQRRSLRLTSRDSFLGPILLILAAVVLGFVCWGLVGLWQSSERTVTVQVVSKERVCDSTSTGSDCKYLVFTDHGTFKLVDSILYGNFRSSDLYGSLRQDHCYTFKVHGYRLPFWSTYPNIVRSVEVQCA